MQFLALCPFGLEKLLKDELKALGMTVASNAAGKVFFEGDWEAVYAANLHLRTAERVLLVVGSFPASNFDELFEGVVSLDWHEWLTPRTTIVIEKVKTYQSKLTSVPVVQAMVQKALFQKLCSEWNLRSLEQRGPTVGVRVYLEYDRALAAIDTTGIALHNRGYRKHAGAAPMKENLAASLLLFSGWRRKFPLYDPLCGSATILTEALLFAYNLPPGLQRTFSFEHLVPYQKLDWQICRDDARDAADTGYRVRICGSDKDDHVLNAARANLAALGLTDKVKLLKLSMEEAKADQIDDLEPGETGFLITNPPYGERLETREHAQNLSRQMRHFEKSFPGWKIGVLTALADFPVQIDRKPYAVREMVNGSIPVKYYQFQ